MGGIILHAPLPDGGTLLHNLVQMRGAPRASWPEEVGFLDHLLALGIDINARDDQGCTMLHLAAARVALDDPADVALLVARGADPGMRDKKGNRPADHLARKPRAVRAALR